MKVALLVSIMCLLLIVFVPSIQAVSETPSEMVNATVTEIQINDETNYYKLLLTSGSNKGRQIDITEPATQNDRNYQQNDRLILRESLNTDEDSQYEIIDKLRTPQLFSLFILFLVLVLLVAGLTGLRSFISLGLSFVVLFVVTLPLLLKGYPPVPIAVMTSVLIALASFYIGHGVSRKTTIALVSTLITLLICAVLGQIYVNISGLTGATTDESSFIYLQLGQFINFKGILLAGIIIGALGVLDDITISQSAIVAELKSLHPKIGRLEVYKSSMKIGKDHIASLVNTLVLAYTGASLPLLLLFSLSHSNFTNVINLEQIAEEVVRTLVGSIALVLAVPITSALAAYFILPEEKNEA